MNVDVDKALVDVSNKVQIARRNLPDGVDQPIFRKVDINAMAFLVVAFKSTLPPKEARTVIEDTIAPRLSRVEGVGQINVLGGENRRSTPPGPQAMSDYRVVSRPWRDRGGEQ